MNKILKTLGLALGVGSMVQCTSNEESAATVPVPEPTPMVMVDSNCIFDLATQTDEFIQEVPAFANYVWDPDNKLAVVVLENGEQLSITRGGCDTYVQAVELYSDLDTISWTNTAHWVKRIQECYHQIPGFDVQMADSLLADPGTPETRSEKFTFWSWPSESYLGGVEFLVAQDDLGVVVNFSYFQN